MSRKEQQKKWFARNEQAEALEKEGREAEALALYEANASEGCDLSYTYERMAAIYRHRQRYDEELRALEQAYFIERDRGPSSQLVRIQQRIELSYQVRDRHQAAAREVRLADAADTGAYRNTQQQPGGCIGVVAACLFVGSVAWWLA